MTATLERPQIHHVHDAESGLVGVIVIDSTSLGPAAGGCRFWSYPDAEAMMADATRLARGMSYKNALARLPLGGGKSVIQRPSGDFNRAALFAAFGRAVDALGGAYITAEDVGTTVADMRAIRGATRFVAGLDSASGSAGGDPSPWTALGVFECMAIAAAQRDIALERATVAVQGVGNVGSRLCRLLTDAGATLVIADIDDARAATLAAELGATHVGVDEILQVPADIVAPCGVGGALNARSIPQIQARVVCGAANNQLETKLDGERLRTRGILYAPDYVVNAGGIISVCAEYLGQRATAVEQDVRRIAERLCEILTRAEEESVSPVQIADVRAQEIIDRGQ